MEIFNQYNYYRKVNVVSDHKHLECILKKALANAPKRLHGMMMRLQKYDVDLMYVPGKNRHLADTLSRAHRPITEGLPKDFEHVHVVGHVPISESRLEAIRTATEADQVRTALKQVILQVWPEERSHLRLLVHLNFAMRDEFAVGNGIVFRANALLYQPARGAFYKRGSINHT